MTIKNVPRKGDWIQTYNGRKFWPLDPKPEEIFINDIAHALSLICRYAGHCTGFYSVAQHSVYAAHLLPKELALSGLMHDAPEAYISDMPKPVKIFLPEYNQIEKGIEETIALKYNLPWPMPSKVKEIDWVLLKTEARDLMAPVNSDWYFPYGIIEMDETIKPWTADKAELMFHLHFDTIRNGENLSKLHKYVFDL